MRLLLLLLQLLPPELLELLLSLWVDWKGGVSSAR
jgi:hypothetical protein